MRRSRRHPVMSVGAAALLFLLSTSAHGQETNGSSENGRANQETPSSRVTFNVENHPSLRFGSLLRVDFVTKLQVDFRDASTDREIDNGAWHVPRRRFSVEGTFLRHFEYEVERDLRDGPNPWRDVFVNVRYFRPLQVQAGRFKVPFGLEWLTGATNLDFVYRARPADLLSPGRDIGVQAHGRLFGRTVRYRTGWFEGDGDYPESTGMSNAGRTVAVSVDARPLRLNRAPDALQDLEVGFGWTRSAVPEGLSGIQGRTVLRETFFEPVYVRGHKRRVGTHVDWTTGPFSIKSEYIRVDEDRKSQGIDGEDLPELLARGWYVGATYLLTGEDKEDNLRPRKNFLSQGWGALEVAARFERVSFGGESQPDAPPATNPRAPNIAGNSDRAWTLGLNWYPNRFVKLQANLVRESLENMNRSPVPDRQLYWSRVFRIQFVL